MSILLLVAIALVAVALYVPQWHTRRILAKFSQPHPTLPGTGAQYAEHLLKSQGINHVRVEETPDGDHYDPTAKVVRLSPANFHSNSLTAIVTAAHEVGHAIQDAQGYEPLQRRTEMVTRAQGFARFSGFALIALPVLLVVVHSPILAALAFAIGFVSQFGGVLVSITTLPVELDASFKRAMPLLEQGGLLSPKELYNAKRILRACAMTYVAGSLSSLLNLWKWMKAIKR
jgi:Zn-dependent membrane protease YugP